MAVAHYRPDFAASPTKTSDLLSFGNFAGRAPLRTVPGTGTYSRAENRGCSHRNFHPHERMTTHHQHGYAKTAKKKLPAPRGSQSLGPQKPTIPPGSGNRFPQA